MLRCSSFAVVAICAALLVVNSSATPNNTHEWHYGSSGVLDWKTTYNACALTSQSPINIDSDQLKYSSKLEVVELFNYDKKPNNLTMVNNGHTVQVNVDGTQYIDQGGLPTTYHLKQFHFHWGSTNNVGSEHTIDGKRYPMEMHLVHSAVREGSISDAMTKNQGLAVLGFMFTISSSDNPVLEPFIEGLQHVGFKGLTTDIDEFAIASILPAKLTHYYRYMGSLTTPPCHESVVWTVFNTPITISQTQLNKFRAVHSNTQQDLVGKVLVDNYRPVQPTNKRIVWTSVQGGGGTVTCMALSFALPTLIILLNHFFLFLI